LAIQLQEENYDPAKEKELRVALQGLLEQEEVKWKQRAKETWLKFGDRNTKYYHACANQKHKRSQIEQIIDKDGRTCSTQQEVEKAFISYFEDFFKASDNLAVDESIGAVEKKVTPAMNQRLLAAFTQDDINTALNQMAALKAPGPDGFSVCFFQQNWTTVHREVSNAILHFFQSGELDAFINSTNISLVPKKTSPNSCNRLQAY
jgi:hypothetical protein